MLVLLFVMVIARAATAEKAKPQAVNVKVIATPPPISVEGFLETNNLWQIDSANDFRKAINKKCWHPNSKAKAAMPDLGTVCFAAADQHTDVTITVVARGVNSQSLGQRTTMSAYNGVLVADTVPTSGVTRWVSIVLSTGTYKKEFIAWSTNTSRWSLGAWKQDAGLLAKLVMDWCLLNQAKLREKSN